ncbi:ATP-dependent protease ATP-binding subunit [Pseudomonas phage phiPA1-3]|nr:ATP-dependent protease ATP-binding subunit [Pseudomonas phage phiPA1-3]
MSQANEKTIERIGKILLIFKASEGEIRPHFWLTGPSGSGKSFNIMDQCNRLDIMLPMTEVNCASLTKEGYSGLSLSKALAPLATLGNVPNVVFCDEMDKLFLSGNSNDSHANEISIGVQNEFLRVLEGSTTQTFGDYGKYNTVCVERSLFIFAGAFNGQENMDATELLKCGVKTEFIGRTGLVYNLEKPTLEALVQYLKESELWANYRSLFPKEDHKKAEKWLIKEIGRQYPDSNIGVRLINTLIHQYYINAGEDSKPQAGKKEFARTLDFSTGRLK